MLKIFFSLLLISTPVYAMADHDEMMEKTVEAIAKTYKIDVALEDTAERIGRLIVPKEVEPYVAVIVKTGEWVSQQKISLSWRF